MDGEGEGGSAGGEGLLSRDREGSGGKRGRAGNGGGRAVLGGESGGGRAGLCGESGGGRAGLGGESGVKALRLMYDLQQSTVASRPGQAFDVKHL